MTFPPRARSTYCSVGKPTAYQGYVRIWNRSIAFAYPFALPLMMIIVNAVFKRIVSGRSLFFSGSYDTVKEFGAALIISPLHADVTLQIPNPISLNAHFNSRLSFFMLFGFFVNSYIDVQSKSMCLQ